MLQTAHLDFVHEYKGCILERACERIHKPSAVDQKYSVFVPPPFEGIPLALRETEELEQLYDTLVEAVTAGKLFSVYGRNLLAKSLGVESFLSNMPLNLDPGRNLSLRRGDGINEVTFYLAGRFAFTEAHSEDGWSDSVNLMRWGESGAVKLRSLGKNDVFNWSERCLAPHFHKNLMLSVKFLRAKGMLFQLVVQCPGDLVCVGSGAIYQVINLGVSLTEAVNIGGSAWNSSGNRFIPCGCQNIAVDFLRTNIRSQPVVRDNVRV
ncbi:hypothetical protein TSAR_015265 [Trichomalopsis sarcophagae]|uniref:JmjC domain-containing protein n=1 Tax=Trichomalopsis sarcophagae TaxID=543379 RepID=A0A232EEI6_9HYME|nr:hypothetical protein TSAR_015265 [Trichomalopsis sarcophagae]